MRKRSNETTKQFVFRRAEKYVYRLIELQKSSNPKKNSRARRFRSDPWSDIKLSPIFKKNKYGYTPIITKAAK